MFNKKKNKENKDMEQEKEPILEAQLNVDADVENTTEAQAEVPELTAEEKLQIEKAELNDKFLRLFAEFENYKRRTQKERIELLQTASKEVVVSMLPVLDDFDRALKSVENIENDPVKDGLVLIQNKFASILKQKGLKEIESNNQAFDTDLHEAITNIPAPSEDMKGKVIDTMEKGYTLNEKVIRFAKVVVGG